MSRSIMYDIAKEFAEKVKAERSYYDKIDIAIIVSEKGNHAGITGMDIVDNKIVDVPADMIAFLNMRNARAKKVIGMAVMKLDDMTFVPPSEKTLQLMFSLNVDNDSCLVCLGEDKSVPLVELRLGTNMDILENGYDTNGDASEPKKKYVDMPVVKTVEKSVENVNKSTANVISGVEVSSDSPFYEKAEALPPPETTLTTSIDEDSVDNNVEILSSISNEEELNAEELLKQAKKRKDIAKSNFLFRKKHS